MKTLKTIAIAALATTVAGTAVTAYAQGGSAGKAKGGEYAWNMSGKGGHHGMGGRRGAKRFMERFDLNEDGVVDQAEVDKAADARFAEADTDGNGSISLDEVKAQFAERSKDKRVRAFQRLDRDGDGNVTLEEFNKVTDRIFARLDRNDDDVLEIMRGRSGKGPGGEKRGEMKGKGAGAEKRGERKGGGEQKAGRGEGRGERGQQYAMHGKHRGQMGQMRGKGGRDRMRMLFETFDTDADGKITRAEFEEVRGQLFASADTNGSGSFTLDDFQTIWLTINDGRIVRKFQKADKDGDLSITKAEQEERTKDLVERMDRNKDGVVTKADFKRGKKGRGHHGHHRRG